MPLTIREHYRTQFGNRKFLNSSDQPCNYDEFMSDCVSLADTPYDQAAVDDDQHFVDWMTDQANEAT